MSTLTITYGNETRMVEGKKGQGVGIVIPKSNLPLEQSFA